MQTRLQVICLSSECSDQLAYLRCLSKICCLLQGVLNSVECINEQQRLMRLRGSADFKADMQALSDLFLCWDILQNIFRIYINIQSTLIISTSLI